MKSIIRFIKLSSILIVPIGLVLISNSTFATLSEKQLEMFSQNDIMFYDPAEVQRGNCSGSSSICGSTAKEKYWSMLRKNLDELHAAAIMGSLINEGNFGPTRWEIGVLVTGDGGTFKKDWDTLYNCESGSCPGGVGTFGITWTLGQYLRYIDSSDSKLIKYFKDPTNYSFSGDKVIEKIGSDFDRLVELEVNYVMDEADLKSFKNTTTLDDATDWWTKNYENCKNCCGNADKDKSCEQISKRRSNAQKVYEEMKDFTCSGSSNAAATSTTATTCGFVWYGQCDPTWANEVYGNRGSICKSGCGPASFAMLATMLLGRSITPHETNDIAGGNNKEKRDYHGSYGSDAGVTKALVEELADRYNEPGFKYEKVNIPSKDKSEAKEKINEYLKNGWMIHASGSGNNPFTSRGHYIGIRGITSDGKWLIADSNNGYEGKGEENSKKEWDPDEVLEGMRISSGGNIHAISVEGVNCSNGSMSPCANFDSNGLTIEQAKQFMMNYGANKNNSSEKAAGSSLWNNRYCEGHGDKGSNCVTFSAFFMTKFANISNKGAWGDGDQVVSNLKNRSDINASFGTEPKVFSVLSSKPVHTAVVLGHHDGKWIIGHASCKYEGKGKGNGGDGTWDNKGGGSGFITIEASDDPSKWTWHPSGIEFAYLDVDVSAIERYLNNGE